MYLGTCSRMKGCMAWIDVHPIIITQVTSVILIIFWLFIAVVAFYPREDYQFFILRSVSPLVTCIFSVVVILCYLLAIISLQINQSVWLYPARIVSMFSAILGCIQIGNRNFEYDLELIP